MIKIDVEVNSKIWFTKIKNPKRYFSQRIRKIVKIYPFICLKNSHLTVLLTNSSMIKKLNRKFRKKDQDTDILSFPFFTPKDIKLYRKKNIYIGDIAICYKIIKNRSLKTNFLYEFDKTWIHGLLHLMGYDHIKNKDYLKMKKLEKKIINLIKV